MGNLRTRKITRIRNLTHTGIILALGTECLYLESIRRFHQACDRVPKTDGTYILTIEFIPAFFNPTIYAFQLFFNILNRT